MYAWLFIVQRDLHTKKSLCCFFWSMFFVRLVMAEFPSLPSFRPTQHQPPYSSTLTAHSTLYEQKEPPRQSTTTKQ